MNMQRIILSFVLVLCIASGYMLTRTIPAHTNADTIIVGTAAGYAPFVSINEHGEYEGFDIDVANALAKAMGKKLVIKDLGSMTSLLVALEQGSIDMVIWGLSITQERLTKIAMIRYCGDTTTSYPLIFWERIPAHVTSINDMHGMSICVEPSSAQDTVLSKYAFITKVPTEKVDDALLNVQYGKTDAALVEPTIAAKFKAKYPTLVTLDVPLAAEDQVHGIGIAIKKTNTTLCNDVTTAIEQLKLNGTLGMYEQKWSIA